MVPALERELRIAPAGGVSGPALLAGLAALGALGGCAVALAGLNALYLFAGLTGCAFVMRDFRVGVVLLILLMPLSASYVFPHEMFGIKGVNPLNLLLVATLGSYLLRALPEGGLRRFVPRPLLWLYVVPIVIAGALGVRHVPDIAPGFFIYDALDFYDATGYLITLVVKPLLLVIYALLIAAAVAKSEKPEKFLLAGWISIWVMASIAIVYVLQSGIGLAQLAASGEREFFGPLGLHANELGRLYAVAYALLLFTCGETRTAGSRLALLVLMGLIVIALMLTFSRGAFVGFAVVNLLFLLWRRNTSALVVFAVLAMLTLFALPDAVYERVSSGAGKGLNAVSAGRIDGLWLPLLPTLLRNPFFGNGLESILWSEPMRRGAGVGILATTHPHNAYLEGMLDMGLVGLTLLCAYFAHVWKRFRSLARDPSVSATLRGFYQGAAAGLLAILVSDFVDSSLRPTPEQAFLWLAIGMMYGHWKRGQ